MSTKGTTQSPATRQKISLANKKHSKADLIQAGENYITSLLDDSGVLISPPSIVGYCLAAGISRSRLYELTNQYQELADTIEHIEMLQEQYTIACGFSGKSPIFSIFLLKSKHNYKDTPQQLTQNNYMNISPDLLADALQIMNKDKK